MLVKVAGENRGASLRDVEFLEFEDQTVAVGGLVAGPAAGAPLDNLVVGETLAG